jgi:dGTPase
VDTLRHKTKERIHTAIADIYKNSYGKPFVQMSDEVMGAINALRDFMFDRVYAWSNKVIQERAARMLTQMFEYFSSHEKELPEPYFRLLERYSKEQVVCDYISGMTDRYALSVFENIFIPTTFPLSGVSL